MDEWKPRNVSREEFEAGLRGRYISEQSVQKIMKRLDEIEKELREKGIIPDSGTQVGSDNSICHY